MQIDFRKLEFPDNFHALVVGSSGSIGGAFYDYLEQSPGCGQVLAISRSETDAFDLETPESIRHVSNRLHEHAPFHFIIDATGALTIDGTGPEKALARLDAQALQRQFMVNTIGPSLLLKQLLPLMASGDAIYAKLSARVGSITDNQKGGWYGYRASKAAFNMVLQTAAIEFQRKNPKLRVVALQPGTVRSKLSEPFQTNVRQLLEPGEAVAGMMRAMMRLAPKSGAHFIDHQGNEIPW